MVLKALFDIADGNGVSQRLENSPQQFHLVLVIYVISEVVLTMFFVKSCTGCGTFNALTGPKLVLKVNGISGVSVLHSAHSYAYYHAGVFLLFPSTPPAATQGGQCGPLSRAGHSKGGVYLVAYFAWAGSLLGNHPIERGPPPGKRAGPF